MEMVKMVTQMAGEEVFVGECHPARARVLVKKQLASWMDGKVLLHILNVHDKLLASNPEAWHGPLDDGNVSKQEMERRTAWFRSFMEKSSHALTGGVVELPTVEEAEKWTKPVEASIPLSKEARAHIVFSSIDRLRFLFTEDGFDAGSKEGQARLGGIRKDIQEDLLLRIAEEGVGEGVDVWQLTADLMDEAINAGITDEEAATYFDTESCVVSDLKELESVSIPGDDPLQSMWPRDPDVSGVFASPATKTLADYLVEDLPGDSPESFDPDVYKARLERDQRLIEATRVALYAEPPKVIASLRQVQVVRGIRRDPEDIVSGKI